MKIGFVSLGCSKNLVDSERLMGIVTSQGHQLTNDPSEAEVIFVNTCGFIQSAKEESINTILEMADYKEENCKKLYVTGCLAQRYRDELLEALPEVDRIITIDEYKNFDQILQEELPPVTHGCYNGRVLATQPWYGYLKIAEGCSNRCAFCAIPYIRGRYISNDFDELVEEAKHMASLGIKELNIIAQDSSRYGMDKDGKHHLLRLLQTLDKIEGIHWIRILYLYPEEIDEALIKGISELDHVLPYFDLPIQYGGNRILKLMNRRGTVEQMREKIAMIRSYFPHCAIRTTMMVGFPSETEEDFAQLMEFVKDMRFDRLGAFTYSLEEGTPAYSMEPQVEESIKQDRYNRLMTLQQQIAQENAEALVGDTLEVLVEYQDGLTGKYRGRSLYSAPDGIDGYVMFDGNKRHQAGDFAKVLIKQAKMHDLVGVEVDE